MTTAASELDDREGRSAAPAPVVLETKLTRPPVRPEHVVRAELVELLREGRDRPLTLVTAPPGFGKTTLMTAWSDTEGSRVAWLSLDDADNDPVRFVEYLVAALGTVESGLGGRALAANGTPGAGLLEIVLPLLINELAALEEELVLVLDDYHVITNADIHEGLAYLVERRPSSLRLVVATREDPPLPLGRLRARGQLVELRAGELRFSAAEADTFLNEALGLRLSPNDVERLNARTEGWPAALYLAALTLRGRPDPSGQIAAFAGDDRHVVDYLTGEVLARQTPELRSFLLRTSILSRLCGPLCDAVTEGEGSARILTELERSNLFLVPLDGKREWYRYHHLFAELLQRELSQTDGGAIAGLHRRAGAWYRDAGLVVDAANHLSVAGDLDAAIELVGRHWAEFIDLGQLATVSRWLEALPAEVIERNGTLCFAAATVALHTGRLEDAQHWLEAGDRAPRLADDRPQIKAIRAYLPMARGDIVGTLEETRHALAEAETAEEAFILQLTRGIALWWSQEFAEARALLETSTRTAEAAAVPAVALMALSVRAAIEFDCEDAAQAEALTLETLALLRRTGMEQTAWARMAFIVIGKLHAQRGEHDEAVANVEHGIQLNQISQWWDSTVYGLLSLAAIRQRAGEQAEARRALVRARAVLDALPNPGPAEYRRLEQAERLLRLRPARARDTEGAPYWELSERELAVLRLLASKLSQREIAAELYVSLNTVKTHTRAIFRKLGVESRAEAVNRARELGLI